MLVVRSLLRARTTTAAETAGGRTKTTATRRPGGRSAGTENSGEFGRSKLSPRNGVDGTYVREGRALIVGRGIRSGEEASNRDVLGGNHHRCQKKEMATTGGDLRSMLTLRL